MHGHRKTRMNLAGISEESHELRAQRVCRMRNVRFWQIASCHYSERAGAVFLEFLNHRLYFFRVKSKG